MQRWPVDSIYALQHNGPALHPSPNLYEDGGGGADVADDDDDDDDERFQTAKALSSNGAYKSGRPKLQKSSDKWLKSIVRQRRRDGNNEPEHDKRSVLIQHSSNTASTAASNNNAGNNKTNEEPISGDNMSSGSDHLLKQRQQQQQQWTAKAFEMQMSLAKKVMPRASFEQLALLLKRLALAREQSEDCLNLNIYAPGKY